MKMTTKVKLSTASRHLLERGNNKYISAHEDCRHNGKDILPNKGSTNIITHLKLGTCAQ